MTVPPGLTNAIGIASGANHGLAIRANRTVAAWGDNSLGQRAVPFGVANVIALAAGDYYSLALRADGSLVFWGDSSARPAALAGLRNVAAIAGRGGSLLALLGDGPPVTAAALSNPILTPGATTFSLPTQSGRVYALEFTDSIQSGSWSALPLAAGNGAVLPLTDPTATGTQRFYRVRRW
jgi:hypothetical protein